MLDRVSFYWAGKIADIRRRSDLMDMAIKKLTFLSLTFLHVATAAASTDRKALIGSPYIKSNSKKLINNSANDELINEGSNTRGHATVLEGDMLDFDLSAVTTSLANGRIFGKDLLWPSSNVNFKFHEDFPNDFKITVQSAMEMIQNASCIRFHEKTAAQLKNGDKYFTIIMDGGTCASYVSFTCQLVFAESCSPIMYLGRNCSVGDITHQLMHILGYVHEQSRPDRDEHITIIYDNIESCKRGVLKNFQTYNYPLTVTTPYDPESIMHYPSNAFAIPGLNTLSPTGPRPSSKMGQRQYLSKYDKQKLVHNYCASPM